MARPHHSPWFQGLLDREAGCAVEPQDWDIDDRSPGWWCEYTKGVRDFDNHQRNRLAENAIQRFLRYG